ncbi:alcohol dehydrogenase catalytic domain-containing protein [Rhodococcus rhodochrous]|uniref:NADP-dependent oxidoreductase n=1 Tax=Rhodococcus rhodochrous TaxID=1829 RepID=A0AA46WZL9_RHORH|nr:NADP-dependent oxidoreductase [Rhodococcus rhodochrous]MCD2099405.1 NADP-dependent oxidoreductase [Rhodococcus rhodochrous]MCD2123773.1 NADP-dependent oxidoreductase [Rhodococcus rhodochrous]MCQ4136380.1 NADP-dependent oxidoreductase [Rhodococcus rhodochrous]MDJ0020624.1 NADP-dependent oxidoreductase [Rhodococcus rhodochrous]UZF47385.1 NADP-dependent oxidoreductase [Rhodococcus rhodochrous]
MNTSTYRAAVVRIPAGPDSIEIVDLPLREPGAGEIRVDLAAAAVDPVDLAVADGIFHRMGLIHQPEHTGLGWEFAGTIDAVGPGTNLGIGTRVAGLTAGFDRDVGAYAERLIVPAADVAVVPDGLDPIAAASVPLNGLAAAMMVDLLGDPSRGADRLLVTGAAGVLGGYLTVLARDRGWRVTGLARARDEEFVRGLGADFTADAAPGWDAVADAAALQERGLALVRDGGIFVGVRPNAGPVAERGIAVTAVDVRPDGPRTGELLARGIGRVARAGARDRAAREGVRGTPGDGEGRRARPLRPHPVSRSAQNHRNPVARLRRRCFDRCHERPHTPDP